MEPGRIARLGRRYFSYGHRGYLHLKAVWHRPCASYPRDFYAGKLAAARFFATTVLPRLESDRKIIEATTNDLMEIPEGAF